MSNTLIYAMSTKGSMKLEQFNEMFRHVYLPIGSENEEQIDIDARRQAIRMLDSLGYCEFDFDNRVVFMCRPALVLLPSFGLPNALLVGARTPRLVNSIKEAIRAKRKKAILKPFRHSEVYAGIPPAICIEATDKGLLRDIAEKVDIACDVESPAAWKLAVMSASLYEILGTLRFEEREELDWGKKTFIKEWLMFSKYSAEEGSQTLAEYRHPDTRQLYHWIWNNGSAAEISRDWGRYAALANAGNNILMYDRKRFELAVPVTVPLPCLLARAAALCSGIPPYSAISCKQRTSNIPPQHPYQVYSDVPPRVAGMIASKVNQKLLNISFAVEKEGMLHA